MEPLAKKQRVLEEQNEQEDLDDLARDYVRFRAVESVLPEQLKQEFDSGGKVFELEFFHQVFGVEEKIRGYTDLSVNVWISTQTYHSWIDVKFSHKKARADKITEVLNSPDVFKEGCCSSRQEFEDVLKAAAQERRSVLDCGECVLSSELKDGCKLQVQQYKLAEAPQHVQQLHQRMEPLLLFAIDAANFIDPSDPKWDLLLAVRQQADGSELVVGMCTLYTLFHPCNNRMRLSQVFVTPPYQGLGVGKALVQAMYKLAVQRDVLDVTAEDPTDGLIMLREKVDCERALGCKWLVQLAEATAAIGLKEEGEEGEQAAEGKERSDDQQQQDQQQKPAGQHSQQQQSPLALPLEAAARVRQEFKMHMREVRRVWEVLLFMQPGCQTTRGMRLLEQLVQARIDVRVNHLNTKQLCEGKRLVALAKEAEDWIMCKAAPLAEGEDAAAPSLEPEEAPEAEAARRAQLDKEFEDRMEQLEVLAGMLQGQVPDEDGAGEDVDE